MRTYNLFSRTTEQKKVAREGNREIRVAVDSIVNEVERVRVEKITDKASELAFLAGVLLQQRVKPVLLKYSEAGADDTEPREIIAQELCEKLGVFVSSTF